MAWENDAGTFTNPYNFVALDDECRRDNNYEDIKKQQGLLTGYVEIEIETQTPIFVPNTMNDDAFKMINEVKSYDFFCYDDVSGDRRGKYSFPVIPGSEVRGAIRNAFETVTKSCLSTLEKDRILYKRTVVPGNPGKLQFNFETESWEIVQCERIALPKDIYNQTYQNVREGQPVYIESESQGVFQIVTHIENDPQQGYRPGFIHHGEPYGTPEDRKHYESVFVIKEDSETIEIEDNTAIDRFLNNLGFYDDPSVNLNHRKKNRNHAGYEKLAIQGVNDLKENGALIYYNYDPHRNTFYLSPAHISREVFKNTLQNVVKGFTPCIYSDHLCSACALFGMVSDHNAVSSRVRFTDAIPDKTIPINEYFDRYVVLEELASPKPSATEFYLKKPESSEEVEMWNCDYATRNKEIIESTVPEIRGRKFYWHRNIERYEGITNFQEYRRKTMVRPVKPGKRFTAKIFFNTVTEKELNQLLWVLRPRGSNHKNYHKIGMGKPLGLGSIKIDVKEVKIRKIIPNREKKTIEYCWQDFSVPELSDAKALALLGCSKTVHDEFVTITDFDQAPDDLSYPLASDGNIYSWFVGNKAHRDTGGSPMNPIINQVLPKIHPEDPEKRSLPKYRRV